jgi:hypothetical protein
MPGVASELVCAVVGQAFRVEVLPPRQMTFIYRAALIIASMVVVSVDVQAQSAQTQPPTVTSPTRPGEQTPPPPDREGRQGRERRTSRRQVPAEGLRSFDEARPSREAGPVRKEAVLTANVLAGYDDNLTAGLGGGAGAGIAPSAMASGYSGDIDATLSYFAGTNLRSLQIDTTGRLQSYPDYVGRPAAGGAATLTGRTNAGPSTSLSFSQRAGYEPFFTVFSAGASSLPLTSGVADAAPTSGLFERRSVSSITTGSLERWLTRTSALTASYSYHAQYFTNEETGDTRQHSATAGLRVRLATGVRGRVDYRYSDGQYEDRLRGIRPRIDHRIEAGPDVQHVMSRRRSLTLSLAAGAGYIETVSTSNSLPYHAWMPTGRGNLRVALSPGWLLEGDYRRDFQLLQGITDEVYRTDTGSLMTSALVGDRLVLQAGANYGNWKTPVPSGVNDTMDVYGATAQMRVLVSKRLAVSAGYYYYQHRYSNPGALPAGFPARYDRHAVRVGLALWVPLAGTPTAPASGAR